MITRSDATDHSIVYVNPAFEKITGYSADEVIGREGRFLVRDDLQQPDLEEIRTALRESGQELPCCVTTVKTELSSGMSYTSRR
jgi:PAS domain S-box-containing protein